MKVVIEQEQKPNAEHRLFIESESGKFTIHEEFENRREMEDAGRELAKVLRCAFVRRQMVCHETMLVYSDGQRTVTDDDER